MRPLLTPLLLPFLADPRTREPLTLESARTDARGLIVSGTLRSPSGGAFPIVNGIPRFLPPPALGESVASFGDQWNFFNFTGFKEHWRKHTVKHTFGSEEAFRGRLIVDAGGGSGAQTLWMLESGARHVIMLELSHSVDDVVQRNLAPSGFTNYDVIQRSIDAPPLRSRSIDGIVLCHNVIQHTPSVEATAEALFDVVGPVGEFAFNCYQTNAGTPLRWVRFHLVYQPLRALLRRAPFAVTLAYSRAMAALRLLPGLGGALEKAGFCVQGEVPRVEGDGPLAHLRHRYRATLLNTFDGFGGQEFQHHKSDAEIRALVERLQPDPQKVGNAEAYFTRPQPIGCALRVRR